jgi:hypothetical protein
MVDDLCLASRKYMGWGGGQNLGDKFTSGGCPCIQAKQRKEQLNYIYPL